MKRLNIFLVLIVLISSVFFLTPPVAQANSLATVKLSGIHEDVFVKKGGGLREFPATNGMTLSQGDWLRTGAKGSVVMEFTNKTQSTIGANSELIIENLTNSNTLSLSKLKTISIGSFWENISIKLWAGSVWNRVATLLNINDQFQVETPTAIMGVHGTLYLVKVDSNDGLTSGDVFEGLVAFSQNKEQSEGGQQRMVSMGQQLEIKASAPSEQKAIDQKALIESTDNKLLVQVITDVISRAKDLMQSAKDAQANFKQVHDLASISSALDFATKSIELANFAKDFVSTIETSTKIDAVKEVLTQNNITIEQIQTNLDTVKTETKQAQESVISTAKDAGISQDKIDEIILDAVAPPSNPETPPITPQPINNGSSNIVDKTALTSAINDAQTLILSKTVGTAVYNVSQEAYNTFQTAINAASTLLNNSGATQVQIDTQVQNLTEATIAFKNAVITAIPVINVTVTAPENVTSIVYDGTLQMSAAVIPVNATDPSVTWSVINGTGSATFDTDTIGLLKATGVGTITVKALNVVSGVYGTLDLMVIPNFILNVKSGSAFGKRLELPDVIPGDLVELVNGSNGNTRSSVNVTSDTTMPVIFDNVELDGELFLKVRVTRNNIVGEQYVFDTRVSMAAIGTDNTTSITVSGLQAGDQVNLYKASGAQIGSTQSIATDSTSTVFNGVSIVGETGVKVQINRPDPASSTPQMNYNWSDLIQFQVITEQAANDSINILIPSLLSGDIVKVYEYVYGIKQPLTGFEPRISDGLEVLTINGLNSEMQVTVTRGGFESRMHLIKPPQQINFGYSRTDLTNDSIIEVYGLMDGDIVTLQKGSNPTQIVGSLQTASGSEPKVVFNNVYFSNELYLNLHVERTITTGSVTSLLKGDLPILEERFMANIGNIQDGLNNSKVTNVTIGGLSSGEKVSLYKWNTNEQIQTTQTININGDPVEFSDVNVVENGVRVKIERSEVVTPYLYFKWGDLIQFNSMTSIGTNGQETLTVQGLYSGDIVNLYDANGIAIEGKQGLVTDAVYRNVEISGLIPNTYQVEVVRNGFHSNLKMVFIGTGSYQYITSNYPGGPTYNYIDIRSTGTYNQLSDDTYIPAPIGFNFSFYDTNNNKVFLSSNGYLTFGSGDSTYYNYAFPTSGLPRIAPFFDDLMPNDSGSGVYYQTEGTAPNRRLIVQWRLQDHFSESPNTVDFEAILYEGTNNILFQYKDTTFGDSNDYGSSATVGLNKGDGLTALQFSDNTPSLSDRLAILYSPGALNSSILTVSSTPDHSTIDNSTTVTVGVSTLSVVDNTTVTAELVNSNGTSLSPAVSNTSTIHSNAASLSLSVPSTLTGGSYKIKVTVGSGDSTLVDTGRTYVINPPALINTVTVSPGNSITGDTTDASVNVSTSNVFNSTQISAELVNSDGNSLNPPVIASNTIFSNSASFTLTIPGSIAVGSYKIKVTVGSGEFALTYSNTAYTVSQLIISITNVSTINGTVTVTLSEAPATAPVISDFNVTQAIGTAAATNVTPSAISTSGAVVTLTVPAVVATSSDQSVVMSVSYKGATAVSANAYLLLAPL